jgi:Small, acid-soluble spore proteins, alpha/beta type
MANNNRRGNRNALVVPGVDQYLEKFKNEIAAELGVENYGEIDKGALPARVHGMIGGTMTKRLIEMGQQMLAGQDTNQSQLDYPDYVRQMQEEVVGEAPHSYAAAKTVPVPEVAVQGPQQSELH